MNNLQALASLNPASLSSDEAVQSLEICKAVIVKVKAYELLRDVLNDTCSPGHIRRLDVLLKTVSEKTSRRTDRLKQLDPIPFIILGLASSIKVLDRLDEDLFREVVRQAEEAAPRLSSTLLNNQQIISTIFKSGAQPFGESLNQLLQVKIGAKMYDTGLFLLGQECWQFSLPRQDGVFQKLIARSLYKIITAYVPTINHGMDCSIRFTVLFDGALLFNLFGYKAKEHHADSVIELSEGFSHQIKPELGDEIFDAVEASITRTQEGGGEKTSCIKARVFPGHIIVIDVILERSWCLEFVNRCWK